MDARPLTKAGGDHIRTQITSPSGSPADCQIQDNADGTYAVEYTPFEKGNLCCFVVFCLFFHLRGENQQQTSLLTLSFGKLLRSASNLAFWQLFFFASREANSTESIYFNLNK